MKLITREILPKNIVFVTGITRSGKALLLPILASLTNADKASADFFYEQVPTLYEMGLMDEDAASFLLSFGMNLKIYEDYLGRNSNFRPNDLSSVWSFSEPYSYIDRLYRKEGEFAFKEIEKTRNNPKLFPMVIHNALWNAEIWFKSIPSLKMIHMRRSPIDLTYAWFKKGYGALAFCDNPRNMTLTYKYKNHALPYWAKDWEEDYLHKSDIDRIIYSINHIRKKSLESYNKLKTKENILFINHSDITTKTSESLSQICEFVGESRTSSTSEVLIRENCPRDLTKNIPFSTNNLNIDQKILELKKITSSSSFKFLMQMQEEFNSGSISA